tara:strand:+ start:173 stop:1015 length:843 start_codon:yes stop_codon:yes gene_type:complete
MARTQTDKQKKHAAYMREYTRKRKLKNPDFHDKQKKYLKDYYKNRMKKIKSNPAEYEKWKKKEAIRTNLRRKELMKDPQMRQKILNQQKIDHKKRMLKLSKEEKYEIWKKARLKYRSTEKGRAARKKWKQSEKSKEYDRKYRKEYMKDPENREKVNKWNRKYSYEKYHNDVEFRLRHRLSNVMRRAVRAQRTGKSKKTAEIVGCDFQFLIKYLEAKFKDGMSWKNMGEWHIDHIKPCKSFDLTNPEEQKKCFHYSNLQPLWAEENIRKSAKISSRYNNEN